MSYHILDWAGNIKFNGKSFDTFEDAEEYLCEYFEDKGLDYDEERGEYEIEEIDDDNDRDERDCQRESDLMAYYRER
jgi:hypothetical protein